MKQFVFLSFILISSLGFSQTNASVKVTDNYNLKNSDITQIQVDLSGGPVEVTPWAYNTILVETNISSNNVNREAIGSLIKTKRYAVLYQQAENSILLHNEIPPKEIIIRGQVFDENISYRIYVPKSVKIIDKSTP